MKIALALLSTSAVVGIGFLLLLILGQKAPDTIPRVEMQPQVLAQEAPASTTPPITSVVATTPIREEFEHLKLENLDLKRSLDGLSRRLAALELELSEQNDSDGLTESDLSESEQPSPSRSESGETELAALTTALNAETLDSRWAAATEIDIENAFQESGQAGGDLILTECRRTLCRAEVQFDSPAARIYGLERLQMLLSFAESVRSFPLPDSHSAYLYLAREGHILPTLQE